MSVADAANDTGDDAGDEGATTALGDQAPIVALGHRDGIYWVSDAAGQARGISSRGFTTSGVLDLVGGEDGLAWLQGKFAPKSQRKGDPSWDNIGFVAALVTDCQRLGLFDPKDIRGSGVWKAWRGQRLIVNCGYCVLEIIWLDGEPRIRDHRPGWRDGPHVYTAAPALDAPDLTIQATPADVRLLRDYFHRWNYVGLAAPQVDALIGFLGLCYLVGAVPHRPILWAIGEPDAGKSALTKLLAELLADAWWTKNATFASIRDQFKPNPGAFAVIVDEAEAKGGPDRIGEIVELARDAYDWGGGMVSRGGSESSTVRVEAAFALGGVAPPILSPQDQQRSIVVKLRLRFEDAVRDAEWAELRPEIVALGPKLRARMIAVWPRLAGVTAEYARVLGMMGHLGHAVDAWASALAALHLLEDAPLSDVEARCEPFPSSISNGDGRGEHELCWLHLMSSVADQWKGGGQVGVGATILAALEGDSSAREDIKRWGFAVVKRPDELGDEKRYVAVGDRMNGIARLFRGTKWASGNWSTVLQRLQGAAHVYQQRFGNGLRDNAVLVPEMWLDRDEAPKPPEDEGQAL